MNGTKDRFGNGQTTCKVCNKPLSETRVMRIILRHKDGEGLAYMNYLVPLCDEHREGNCMDVEIGWIAGLAPIEAMQVTR